MIDSVGIWKSRNVRIAWSEMTVVSAYKLDEQTNIVTVLTFDHECGDYVEIMSDEPEFEPIFAALDQYLSLPPNWRANLDAPDPNDPVMTLWRRDDVSH